MLTAAIDAKRSGPVTIADRMAKWGHRGAIIRVHDLSIAQSLERKLFDRGCAVGIAEMETAPVLESAGMLAIVIDRSAHETDASKVIRSLEVNDILRPLDRLTQGGGI